MTKKIKIETDMEAGEREPVMENETDETQAGDQPEEAGGEDSSANGNGKSSPEVSSMDSRDADFSRLDEEEDDSSAGKKKASSREVKLLEKEVDEYKAKYLRALADLENFQKRMLKEKSQLLKYQGEKILFDMLEVADNLDLALDHAEADFDKFRTGIEMINKMFLDVLSKWEVKGEPSVGQAFDPEKHNALSRLATEDAVPGTVLNELKKAYFYKDRLLRAADVVVAAEKEVKEKREESENEQEESLTNEGGDPLCENQPSEITDENEGGES